MYYYANFDRADNGITVTFRDIPEAITCGQSNAEALEMAEDALLTCVEIYFDEDRPFPLASKQQKGETAVCLPESRLSDEDTICRKYIARLPWVDAYRCFQYS